MNTALQETTNQELPAFVNMFKCLLCFDAWWRRYDCHTPSLLTPCIYDFETILRLDQRTPMQRIIWTYKHPVRPSHICNGGSLQSSSSSIQQANFGHVGRGNRYWAHEFPACVIRIHVAKLWQSNRFLFFRCHPSFQSDGAMYNWIWADFHGRVYLCRLAPVVVSTDDAANTNDRFKLVVQCTTCATDINLVLSTEWLWSSKYHVIVPSDVKLPWFLVSIKEDTSKILETLPIEEWHKAL